MLSELGSARSKGLGRLVRGSLSRSGNFFSGFRRKLYGPITHVNTATNSVALTFDDGPHPEFTIALLQILRRFRAKATFFMVGETAARYPEVVKRVADEGHAIGNHSFSHSSFVRLDGKARRRELERCAEVLFPYEEKLFRPPFGAENLLSHHDVVSLGYSAIKWSVSPDDWQEHSATWLDERLQTNVKPGAIVLLHDNRWDDPTSNRTHTLDAVERILIRTSDFFDFCTVPKLLARGEPMSSFGADG